MSSEKESGGGSFRSGSCASGRSRAHSARSRAPPSRGTREASVKTWRRNGERATEIQCVFLVYCCCCLSPFASARRFGRIRLESRCHVGGALHSLQRTALRDQSIYLTQTLMVACLLPHSTPSASIDLATNTHATALCTRMRHIY